MKRVLSLAALTLAGCAANHRHLDEAINDRTRTVVEAAIKARAKDIDQTGTRGTGEFETSLTAKWEF